MYHFLKNDEGLRQLTDNALNQAHHRLRVATGKDYRIEAWIASKSPSLLNFFRFLAPEWCYGLYLPVHGGVNGKSAWTLFNDRYYSAEELRHVIDAMLLGIELGQGQHREDLDALRKENDELTREIDALASENELAQQSDAAYYRRHATCHGFVAAGSYTIVPVSHLENPEEGQYLGIMNELHTELVAHGATPNRTDTPAAKVFGRTMRFDLSGGKLPLFTTKKLHLKSIVLELIWFLKGLTNNEWLRQQGVNIWLQWATEDDGKDRKKQPLPKGSVGPLYGEQWRRFPAGEFFYNLTDEELDTYLTHMASADRQALLNECGEHHIHEGMLVDFTVARQWLTKRGIDQISQTLFLLKNRPDSRRIIVTSWNPQVVPSDSLSPQENVKRRRAALAACHTLIHFVTKPLTFDERVTMIRAYFREIDRQDDIFDKTQLIVTEENINGYRMTNGQCFPTHRLNCSMYQRSADMLQGCPFNVASYALLTHMVAKEVNMVPGELLWIGGDVHLYKDHLEAIEEQLQREPRPFPTIKLRDVPSLFDYTLKDIIIEDYNPHASIKAPVAV